MTCAIEDAGFDIRDQIMWVYGSGFPKSHDVSKAIDKMAGAEREGIGEQKALGNARGKGRGGQYANSITAIDGYEITKDKWSITAPATDAAKEWDGWGTALKPAHEPICVARKPLIGTVAENVLQYGTGAINVDGCRVGNNGGTKASEFFSGTKTVSAYVNGLNGNKKPISINTGRWPANFIHDGSAEVMAGFPETKSEGHWPQTKVTGYGDFGGGTNDYYGVGKKSKDKGSAARFFYCAKASKKDRDEGLEGFEDKDGGHYAQDEWSRQNMGNTPDEQRHPRKNNHPTVKPTDLMQYLCRLVTPPNGIILDPFTGSGSTGKGAVKEGFRFIGFEQDAEYCKIAEARIQFALKSLKSIKIENTLFRNE